MATRPIVTFVTAPRECSYLPEQRSSLEYRVHATMGDAEYLAMLERGWRRQGAHFFRPQCPTCRECRPLRVDVNAFSISKSQRRALAKNADVECILRPARLSDEHLQVFNDYHTDMSQRKGWKHEETDASDYSSAFLMGQWPFAYEMAYYRRGELVGIGLVDLLPNALSSVYFYHAPHWRNDSPGTFSILQEILYCQQTDRRWNYLGYWVEGCGSMTYKSRYQPHELLTEFVPDTETPLWKLNHN